MGAAIGNVLVPGIGVALMPFPIIAVILMLLSPRAKTNGPAFVFGWVLGVVVALIIALLLLSPDEVSGEHGEPSNWASLVLLVIGLANIALAYVSWRRRPKEGAAVEMPKWTTSIDKVNPAVAFIMGILLELPRPKNLLCVFAAATAITSADLSTAEALVPAVVFVLLASSGVGLPVVLYLATPQRAAKTLEEWKGWLAVNNSLVLGVVMLVLGVTFFGQGLGGLID